LHRYSGIMICLVLLIFSVIPAAQASPNVESRIVSAIAWIEGQQVSNSVYTGFARGVSFPHNQTVYVEDQALIAFALSDYHSTHNDVQYDNLLERAAKFIMSARTEKGDFYEYYDLRNGEWRHYGDLHGWNAYAVAGLATAAYKISSKSCDKRVFWLPIEARLKDCVYVFIDRQRHDGAWLFRQSSSAAYEALTRENALWLVGLV